MKTPNEQKESDAGSRMHVLDWLELPQFLPTLRELVTPIGFTISESAARQPKGRNDHRESVLVGQKEPFLSKDQQDRLQDWWLVHKEGAKLPTWDLVVAASNSCHQPALVLVEAKAHGTELSELGNLRLGERHLNNRRVPTPTTSESGTQFPRQQLHCGGSFQKFR